VAALSPARNLDALAERASQLVLTPRRERVLGMVAAATLVAAIVGLIVLPTGASSATAVVPAGERVEATTTVRDARVMVLSRKGRVHLFVAYERNGGWHGVEVKAPPADSAAAWAATRGGSGVPPLSAVYGRATASRVQVLWADGSKTDAAVTDGTWLVTRPGHVRSKSVTVLAADGSVVSTIDGP
jgi:hypothetical protein